MSYLLPLIHCLAAYVLIDALSGIYHWATDNRFNVRGQIDLFLDHHQTNTMQGFDWQTFAAGMPITAIGGWLHSPFLIACGVFTALTQVTHYYAHRRSESLAVHRIVRWLQEARVIVHPASHSRHHKAPHDQDFCLLSGWNNWWMNAVLKCAWFR
jgi:palmitoyl-[glycerolipid] 3-(E)-desaturase